MTAQLLRMCVILDNNCDYASLALLSGISVLYVKAPAKSVNLFAFLSPFSAYVWLLMIGSGLLVSLTIFVIARYVHMHADVTTSMHHIHMH